MSPSRWLLKTEPEHYGWEDLIRDKETIWDGVKAPAAQHKIASMKKGDPVLIYHTGKEKAIRGIGEVTCSPFVLPKTKEKGKGALLAFKVAARQALPRPVTLKQIKESGLFPDWELVLMPRLSVVSISEAQWAKIMEWGDPRC